MPARRAPTPYPVFRKTKTKPESEKQNEIAEYCKEMLQKSMLTGVPQIVTAPTTRSKVFKTFVFLGSITGFLYQTSAFLVIYFSYPTLVDVQVTTPPYVDVPSITVCNRNGRMADEGLIILDISRIFTHRRLRRNEYCRLKPSNCEPVTNIPKFCSSYPIFCANGTIKGSNMFPRESAIIEEATATQEIMEKIGHKSYPLISSCDFGDVNVTFDYCKNTSFTAFMFQDLYGKMKKCYIINARWTKSSLNLPVVPTRAVLRLILDLEPEEYFRLGRPAGGQLAIHSPWNILNPFNEGFIVKPRKTYIIQIKENIKNLLPWPYQTNCTDYIKKWEIRGRNGPLSKQMCIEECILNQTMNSCSCVLTNNLYPHNFNFCAEATDYCTKQVNYTHCFVKCSPECHARDFEYTLREEDIELDVENHTERKLNWNKTVELLLLFKRTQVNLYRYRAKYESIELFSFLGGFVGIWLGVSLIALLDFLESLTTFIVFLVDRFKASPRISNIRSAIGSRLRSNSNFSTDDSSPWARPQNPHHNNNLRVSFDRKNSVIP